MYSCHASCRKLKQIFCCASLHQVVELWEGITKSGGRDTVWLSKTAGSSNDENEVTATWDGSIYFLSQVIGGTEDHSVVSPVFVQQVQNLVRSDNGNPNNNANKVCFRTGVINMIVSSENA